MLVFRSTVHTRTRGRRADPRGGAHTHVNTPPSGPVLTFPFPNPVSVFFVSGPVLTFPFPNPVSVFFVSQIRIRSGELRPPARAARKTGGGEALRGAPAAGEARRGDDVAAEGPWGRAP